MNTGLQLVFKQDASEVLMTDSRRLAEGLDIRHDNVIQRIEKVLDKTPNDFHKLNIQLVNIIEENSIGGTVSRKHYQLTRDGFLYISRMFTTEKANQFAIKVISAFNQMEKDLIKRHVELPTFVTADMMLQIGTRMKELETEVVSLSEARDHAIKTKGQISTSREAQALINLRWAKEEVNKMTLKLVSIESQLQVAKISSVHVDQINRAIGIRRKAEGLEGRTTGRFLKWIKGHFNLSTSETYKDLPLSSYDDVINLISNSPLPLWIKASDVPLN